ncbi:hypothetical protein GUITHDRAFT_156212 [Guillardia theta CCMP2712]|uniref:Uncharacterized protein n=1 Tax=Guillardia theta (strain CCMP2712) TaxID=905079 RepID=L1I9W4_GUITC|nr:hypothetical protein GUITHDRAFT_156212 [Guillardia theta CCMP2712]EKX32872.1 hypothetical protein GUITHDRAFT_156212 [Guillardia theta CCMP2712]|mmetsp:Transcript_8924/g.29831  ORF Transcript_8924/g.29831 Transcript_8924/m.29831 type:complete len:82 (+) Transcript_8924:68-313(+)|eukprot:XP_005819852.1 hypothetical protein GUITHDRAFT_156212 [Guillardia theta CCMP2712]
MFKTIRETQELFESFHDPSSPIFEELQSTSFSLQDYASQYEQARSAYLEAAQAVKMATGPYEAARDAYVAAAATYTKSLYA